MLVDPETITLPLLILGNVAAVLSGVFWIWQSNMIALKTRQPQPRTSQSVVKILACISAFWTFYFIAITNWEIL